MISALSPTEVLRVFGVVVVISGVLVFLVYILPSRLRRASGAITFVRYALYSVALASSILVVASDHRIVDLAWRTFPFLDRFAPNLNGTFTLQTSSNWPLKKRMRDAYEARAGSATEEEVNIDQLQVTQRRVTRSDGSIHGPHEIRAAERRPLTFAIRGRRVEPSQESKLGGV